MTHLRQSVRRHLARLRQRTLWLAACVWFFQTLTPPALIGASLMAMAPPAHANCTPDITTGTYIYTAANITQAATLDVQQTWNCYSGNTTTASSSQYICYMVDDFGSSAPGSNGGTLPFTLRLYRSNGGTSANTSAANPPTSGHWYGRVSTPSPNLTKLRFNVAGNSASQTSIAGTYTASAGLHIDEQQNGGNCEGDTGGWDSGNAVITGNFVVPSFCSLVTVNTLDFGNLTIGPLTSAVDKTTTLTVKCNTAAAYTVYLGDGQNRVGSGTGLRQMANGTARLVYQLYKDSSHSTVWDATGMGSGVTGGTGGVNGNGNGSNQSLTVYGRIAAGTNVPAIAGNYQDTVVVTVAY